LGDTWAAANWYQHKGLIRVAICVPAASHITLGELGDHISEISLVHPLLRAVLEPLDLA
jgi:hypothetical protein